ncbi:MAG: glycosyltransferase family 4 protein [Pseudomonadota bacterium]
MCKASELEPNILPPPHLERGYLAPWNDPSYGPIAEAFSRLPDAPVAHVILVPHGKLGGSDYLSAVLAQSLSATGPTIIMRTDRSDWDKADWYPDDVPAIDLSKPLACTNAPVLALYSVLKRLNPKSIFTVNSRLGFEVIKQFGPQLNHYHRLYAYFFCADMRADGFQTGYPVWYPGHILPSLDAAFFDTEVLRTTIIDRFAVPSQLHDRLLTMPSPARSSEFQDPVVHEQLASQPSRERPKILWGGRLDRQKRFDLVVEIAKAMPHVDFCAWGQSVLETSAPVRFLPSNLSLSPPFNSYSDLPLTACDGWLYTSAWDGLPTTLVDLATKGMPIVASSVGGVPELIDESTGWPVKEWGSVDAYTHSLSAMLADPEARRARAQQLQERAVKRHTRKAFDAKLREALEMPRGDHVDGL